MPEDAHKPPFDLDAHVALRDPESMPVLMRRCMFSVIQQRIGKVDPSYEDFITGFNIAAWSLTTAGRKKAGTKKGGGKKTNKSQARLEKGTLKLRGIGKKLEQEKRRLPDTAEKMRAINKWAELLRTENEERATMTWKEWSRTRGRRPPT